MQIYQEVRAIVKEGLSHVSTPSAQIAEREIVRRVNSLIESHYKELTHFKDTSIGLWATDIEPKDKTNFFQITPNNQPQGATDQP